MSYFLFGIIRRSETNERDMEKLGWKIVETGGEYQLHVLLGPNVQQQVVMEVLREQTSPQESTDVRFLVTGSPLRDTSDELISPYHMRSPAEAGDTWDRVGKWLEKVLHLPGVGSITLLVSEGYDIDYLELQTAPEQLAGKITTLFQECENEPSVRIVVNNCPLVDY